MEYINKAIFVAFMASFGAMIGYIAMVGMDRQEVADCRKLRQQSVEYAPHFFLATWEDEMCRAHGIIINAPIKK